MKGYDPVSEQAGENENEALLAAEAGNLHPGAVPWPSSAKVLGTTFKTSNNLKHLFSFGAGVIFCVACQIVFPSLCFGKASSTSYLELPDRTLTPTFPGSGVSDRYPPSEPTNAISSYFPPYVGYPGPTPTGVEAGVIATAPQYPIHSGAPNLLAPAQILRTAGTKNLSFDIFRYWGNLRHVQISP
jgi:hypothetical protein